MTLLLVEIHQWFVMPTSKLTRPLAVSTAVQTLSLWSRPRSGVERVRRDATRNGTDEKAAKLQVTATIIPSPAVALPCSAGIVASALAVLSYTHLIRCRRRNGEAATRFVCADFVFGFCCTAILYGTVWKPRHTGWDWSLSEGTLSISQGTFSQQWRASDILKRRTQWTWHQLKASVVYLGSAHWNTIIAGEGRLPALK